MTDSAGEIGQRVEWVDPNQVDLPDGFSRWPCMICRGALPIGQRKVHSGVCGRERERQLQQKRRQARRIARPDHARRAD